MDMAFTTWAAHLTDIKDVLANAVSAGGFLLSSVSAIGPDGVPHTFRTLDEIRRYIGYVEAKVEQEEAATSGRGRRIYSGMVQ